MTSVNSQSWKPARLLQSGPLLQSLMSLSRWLNLKLYGVSGPLGTQPTPPRLDSGGMYLVQTGTVTTITDINGFTSNISFPKPFPNGVLMIMAQPYGATGAAGFAGRVHAVTLSQFYLTTNGPNLTDVKISYIAIGY